MTIDVTASHITFGVKGCPSLCPVALAASEAFGAPCKVGRRFIGVPTLLGGKVKKETFIELPDAIRAWIDEYDEGLEVHPIIFEVTP